MAFAKTPKRLKLAVLSVPFKIIPWYVGMSRAGTVQTRVQSLHLLVSLLKYGECAHALSILRSHCNHLTYTLV